MLLKRYPEAIETLGYITKENRLKQGLNKSHFIDACVIASGGDKFILPENYFAKKHISRGDYQLCKGARGETKITMGKICGFRKFDKAIYLGKEYFIKGRMSNGHAILMDINGEKIDFSHMPRGYKTPKLENCQRIQARRSMLCTRTKITPNIVC